MRQKNCRNLDPQFIKRWSPRAFTDEKLTEEQIFTIFEAARWAPSCFNEQPWHFVVATSEDDRALFSRGLVESNRIWASKAPVIGFVFTRKTFAKTGKENAWAHFDAGAAWVSLALQALKMEIYCHAMAGIEKQTAFEVTGMNRDDYDVICGLVMGKKGDKSELPEKLQEREEPSDRKPIEKVFSIGPQSPR